VFKSLKFIKNNIPAFAGGAAGTVATATEAESSSVKKLLSTIGSKLKTPVFKSNVVEAVNKIPNKGSGTQILGQIKNIPGVKESELKWIGLDDFLKNKKSVTKQEVSEFVQANRIDVNEVKFGGGSEVLLQDLTNKRLKFEEKWFQNKRKEFGGEFIDDPKFDKEGYINQYVNYDNIEIFNKVDNTYTTIPFDTMTSYFGDDILTGVIKPNKIFAGPEKQKYTISDIELEKFKIEDEVRKWRAKGSKPKFEEQYTEPGGKDYTELVFSLRKGGKDIGIPTEISERKLLGRKEGIFSTEETRELIPSKRKTLIPYKNPAHMDVKSEIAHVRFKTRDLNGKKVLTVEEIQSDFAIAVRKGFRPNNVGRDKKITDFPFKNTWYELTVKRLIRYAADNGFDAVAIPKGSVAAARYGQKGGLATKVQIRDLDNHIQVFYKDKKGELISDPIAYKISTWNVVGRGLEEAEAITKFKKAVGEDIANSYLEKLNKRRAAGTDKRMMSLTLPMQTFDFKKPIFAGSGKGKHELYDLAIPSFMKKYGKKWNAKVYDDVIGYKVRGVRLDPDMPVTILEITPAMKKAVQEGSQSLFEILGFATAAGATAATLSGNEAEANPKLAVEFLKAAGKKVRDLKKIQGGTGRKVFELDNEKVIKIAKKQRGLRENDLEGDFVVKNWLPEFHTSGRDYVVVEKVARNDKELRQFLKPLWRFNQYDFLNKTSELQEALTKMELGDFMNYDLAWEDFIAPRNWGKTKDGRFVLLDAGALDINTIKYSSSRYVFTDESSHTHKTMLEKDWDEILNDRRAAGMGKFIIVLTAGGQGYKILENQKIILDKNK
jgi:hypothetical protein